MVGYPKEEYIVKILETELVIRNGKRFKLNKSNSYKFKSEQATFAFFGLTHAARSRPPKYLYHLHFRHKHMIYSRLDPGQLITKKPKNHMKQTSFNQNSIIIESIQSFLFYPYFAKPMRRKMADHWENFFLNHPIFD